MDDGEIRVSPSTCGRLTRKSNHSRQTLFLSRKTAVSDFARSLYGIWKRRTVMQPRARLKLGGNEQDLDGKQPK